ncbi:C-type lectin BfL-1-like isoform X2 [Etheostoma cragini]|uniref:C-type lectin BfL-1-like isoform X2 n=1 Tax=Etheostoma cragini TaxID=417921 RepID=UPI00155E5B6C|nr:C-type lectin BfL-1-like isoform X2 [Etheostoma cragini]XP_034722818.1 C-type lectin BfL-1-like isoform X2 [Etheostoma cragini]
MRPVVVTAILLLVVLMSISDSEAGDPAEMCKTKYPATPCRNKNLGEGWFQMGNNRCVKAFFNNPNLSFFAAEVTCGKFPKGHLVSILDGEEMNQVQCAMYRATTGKAHYWIGMYRKEVVGRTRKWAWTDGNFIAYTKWARGQPDNFLFREGCIEMNYWDWGLWNDANCNLKRPYVCLVNVKDD